MKAYPEREILREGDIFILPTSTDANPSADEDSSTYLVEGFKRGHMTVHPLDGEPGACAVPFSEIPSPDEFDRIYHVDHFSSGLRSDYIETVVDNLRRVPGELKYALSAEMSVHPNSQWESFTAYSHLKDGVFSRASFSVGRDEFYPEIYGFDPVNSGLLDPKHKTSSGGYSSEVRDFYLQEKPALRAVNHFLQEGLELNAERLIGYPLINGSMASPSAMGLLRAFILENPGKGEKGERPGKIKRFTSLEAAYQEVQAVHERLTVVETNPGDFLGASGLGRYLLG